MSKKFQVREYKDCQQVTDPGDQDNAYFVLSGQVNIIAEERNFKKVNMCVRRTRKRRARAKERDPLGLGEERQHDDCEHGNTAEEEQTFHSDFPHDQLAKPEYKRILVDQTFGNDKVITNKGFRPSFGIAEGETTKILSIPLKTIERAIHIIANSGENKEKFEFFKRFPWYANYG